MNDINVNRDLEKRYDLPFCLSYISVSSQESEMDRHKLELLPNGMPVCTVGFGHPKKSGWVKCRALIDTGAEISCLDPSVFDVLELDESELKPTELSGFDKDERTVKATLVVKVPIEVWGYNKIEVVRWSLDHRKEYRAIIGMNFLKKVRFVYNGIGKEAWIDHQ